jgi:hypothetical protein
MLLFGATVILAQTPALVNVAPQIAANRSIAYVPGQGGPNHREWLKVTTTTNLQGQITVRTNLAYTEIATGLNFWDEGTGQWKESSEEIYALPGAAVATNGQTKVIFASNPNTSVAVDMVVGQHRWQSHVLGLSYLDTATGSNVLISELKDNCQGVIVPPSQVVYPDAFTDFKASIVYSYARSGIEQWVLMEERPPFLPEAFGLHSETTVLQVLTEFVSAPQPTIREDVIPSGDGRWVADQNLDFDDMVIGPGKAFASGGDELPGIPVQKQWANLDGRIILAESISVAAAAASLDQLPTPAQAGVGPVSGSVRHIVSAKRLLPGPKLAKAAHGEMKIAQIRPRGFSIDYSTLSTSLTNQDFLSDSVFFLSANVSLFGSNTIFEGGSVLKFASNVTLTVNTPVTWLGNDFRPVVMLSKDDNSAGDSISGSTGLPKTNFYAATALYFNSAAAGTNLVVKNLRVLNAQTAVAISGGTGHVLADVQLVNCRNGIAATNADFSLRNALFANVLTNFTGSSATGRVEHLTSDTAIWLNQSIGANLFLTNCLLVAVTNQGSCTTQNVAIVSSSTGIFQSAAWGRHYLADGSPYRNSGTTNLNTNTLAELSLKTTAPPIVYSNVVITAGTSLTFNPQAQRNSGIPDLGFHYCPIDYIFAGSTTTVSVVFAPGTSVGWFRTTSGFTYAGFGLHLNDSTAATFNGTEQAPCYWVRCNTVQESDSSGGFGIGGIEGTTYPHSAATPVITATFLRCSALTDQEDMHFRDDFGTLQEQLSNCEFYTGSVGGYNVIGFYTNCLFDRVSFWHQTGDSSYPAMYFRNCLWHGTSLSFAHQEVSPYWITSIRDSAYDGTTISLSGTTNASDYTYNAFLTGANRLIPTNANDVVVTSFNWQIGPLGNYYQSTNTLLKDKGSRTADLAGLYHFTTQTNQIRETNSIVDISYHYVALNSSGFPDDVDGDTLPDYLEDSNGDGTFDTGDLSDWKNYTSSNGLVLTNGLVVFTPLK